MLSSEELKLKPYNIYYLIL